MTTITSSQFNPQIIRFPKDGKPSLAANEWQVWNGEQDEGGIPDLEHGAHKVLVPFHWWITHHKNADIIERANILDRLFRSLQMASGNIPGSLAVATLAAQFFLQWCFNRVPWLFNYNVSGAIEARPLSA